MVRYDVLQSSLHSTLDEVPAPMWWPFLHELLRYLQGNLRPAVEAANLNHTIQELDDIARNGSGLEDWDHKCDALQNFLAEQPRLAVLPLVNGPGLEREHPGYLVERFAELTHAAFCSINGLELFVHMITAEARARELSGEVGIRAHYNFRNTMLFRYQLIPNSKKLGIFSAIKNRYGVYSCRILSGLDGTSSTSPSYAVGSALRLLYATCDDQSTRLFIYLAWLEYEYTRHNGRRPPSLSLQDGTRPELALLCLRLRKERNYISSRRRENVQGFEEWLSATVNDLLARARKQGIALPVQDSEDINRTRVTPQKALAVINELIKQCKAALSAPPRQKLQLELSDVDAEALTKLPILAGTEQQEWTLNNIKSSREALEEQIRLRFQCEVGDMISKHIARLRQSIFSATQGTP